MDGAMALLLTALGLFACLLAWHFGRRYAPLITPTAALLGIAILGSVGCIGVGVYWLAGGYVVRLAPGAVLVAGGVVGLAVVAAAVALRPRSGGPLE